MPLSRTRLNHVLAVVAPEIRPIETQPDTECYARLVTPLQLSALFRATALPGIITMQGARPAPGGLPQLKGSTVL